MRAPSFTAEASLGRVVSTHGGVKRHGVAGESVQAAQANCASGARCGDPNVGYVCQCPPGQSCHIWAASSDLLPRVLPVVVLDKV
jgi:hypothetical protein